MGPFMGRTPTVSEDNFGLQRALARRELIEREQRAKLMRRRERMERLVAPVKALGAAMEDRAGMVLGRGKESAGKLWHGLVVRVQHGVRGVMERRV